MRTSAILAACTAVRTPVRTAVCTAAAIAAAVASAACAGDALVAPAPPARHAAAVPAATKLTADGHRAVAVIRAATARYHDLDAAIADGFVFLHGCETRPDEGPVGLVYVHLGRLTDGRIDPASPDALIYEPKGAARPTLVGVELAVPYAQWPAAEPPTFLGQSFQSEDEFGVYGLHVWAWRANPAGLFAESNPKVHCDDA